MALMLLPERQSVTVGEVARLLVRSGLPDQLLVLEIFHADQRIERRILRSGRDAEIVEIPIGREHRGGITARLTAMRDHQLLTMSRSIAVPWRDRQLSVEFATFRDQLRPGADESFRVIVRNAAGQLDDELGAAELLAYMYDRSLDAINRHAPPRPYSIYRGGGGEGQLSSSQGTARNGPRLGKGFALPRHVPPLRGDRLLGLSGLGIGGLGELNRFSVHAVELSLAIHFL